MAAGKIFAISFAINAMMGGSFNSVISQSTNAMQQLKEKTTQLNNEQKRLTNLYEQSENELKIYRNTVGGLKAQLDGGKISQSQFEAEVRRAKETLRASSISLDDYKQRMASLRQEATLTQAKLEQFKKATIAKNRAAANFSTARMGMYETAATLTMIGAPVAGMVEAAATFEASMSKVQAITRASGDDIQKLTNNARQLGETTQFSATQAADAMSYLGMAGWNTEQIMAGMPGLLALAAASGTDLARTADIISDDLTAFGLSAEKASHMADVFAVTATRTNTNVEMIGETMKYAAPVARGYGATMEETAALTGLMANAGVKASQAGTSLRAGFLRLAGPPKKAANALDALGISLSDATKEQQEAQDALRALGIDMESYSDNGGPAHKMVAIISDLKEKTADMSKEEKLAALSAIFGTNAATGWLNVLDAGPEVFENLVNEMEHCDGEAEKMAGVMMDNAKGAFTQLKSAMEGVAISVGSIFLPALTSAARGAAAMAGSISKFVQEHQTLTATVVSMAVSLGSIIGLKAVYRYIAAGFLRAKASIDLYILSLENMAASSGKAMTAINQANKAIGSIALQARNAGWAVLNMARNFSLAGALQTAVNGFKALGTAIMSIGRASLTAMFSPLGIAIMAIAATAYLVYSNWEQLGPFFVGLWQQIQAAFAGGWAVIQPALVQLQQSFGLLTDLIGSAMASLGSVFINAFNQISMAVAANSGLFEALGQILTFIAEVLGNVLIGAFITFSNVAVGVITTTVGSIAALIAGAIGVINGLVEFVTGVFTGNWSMAWQGISDIFSSIWNAMEGIANSVLNGIQSTINGIVSSVKGLAGKLPGLGGGGGGTDIAHNARGGIYAKGAFLTTFAEDSPEAAIPLDGSPRAIGLWRQAGEILGVGNDSQPGAGISSGLLRGTTESSAPMNAPPISISLNFTGSFEPKEIQTAVEKAGQTVQRSFMEQMERYNRERGRLSFEQ